MTPKEKKLIKNLLELQISIIVNGITEAKKKRIEKILSKLGFTEEEIEGTYFI